MGKPTSVKRLYLIIFLIRSEPAEVKHLSKRRKRKKALWLLSHKEYSLSSGERNGKSPNLSVLALMGVVRKYFLRVFLLKRKSFRGRIFR